MSDYDPDTNLIVSSEEDIINEINRDDEDDLLMDDNSNNSEDANVDVEIEDKKIKKLNKQRITFIIMAVLGLFVLIATIKKPAKDKKNQKDMGVANEVYVPSFERPSQIVEDTEELGEQEPVEPVINLYEKPPEPPAPVKTSTAPVSKTSSGPGPNDAAIIPVVQGRLFGQDSHIQSPGTSPAGSKGMMGLDEYMDQRLTSLGVSGSGGAVTGGSSAYLSQNMQDDKLDFYNSGRGGEVAGYYISEDTIWNGTIIPGVLITGINTDLPGDIQARVTENIYDSLTGKNLLIPQGSIMIASYNSSVSYAQSRIQIAWNTLIRPDGYQVSLGNMNAVDSKGYSGKKGMINDHFFQYAKAAGIISLFSIVNSEFRESMKGVESETVKNIIAENQGVTNKMGAELIDRTLNIQPTLIVRSGTKISIMTNTNIRFPPIERPAVNRPYSR